jgi:hypothetical protein
MEGFRFDKQLPSMADIVRQLSVLRTFPIECRYHRQLEGSDSIHGPVQTIRQIIQRAESKDSDANPWLHDDSPTSFDLCIPAARSADRRTLGHLHVFLDERECRVHLVFHMNSRHELARSTHLALRRLGGRHAGLSRAKRQQVREQRRRERRITYGFVSLLLAIFVSTAAFFGPGPGAGAVVLFLFLLVSFGMTKVIIQGIQHWTKLRNNRDARVAMALSRVQARGNHQ